VAIRRVQTPPKRAEFLDGGTSPEARLGQQRRQRAGEVVAGVDGELLADVAEVVLDRLRAEEQRRGDDRRPALRASARAHGLAVTSPEQVVDHHLIERLVVAIGDEGVGGRIIE
jgi:hypothetical protein